MPDLTEEHQRYIKNFNLDYVRKTNAKQLEKELELGGNNHKNSLFFQALSEKIIKDEELKFDSGKVYEKAGFELSPFVKIGTKISF